MNEFNIDFKRRVGRFLNRLVMCSSHSQEEDFLI